MKKYYFAIIIILFSSVAPVFSDKRGTAGAAFLKLPIGAQPNALGGSFAAGQGGISIFWNPAGLFYLEQNEINLDSALWVEDVRIGSLAMSFPIRDRKSIPQKKYPAKRRMINPAARTSKFSTKKLGVFSAGLIYLDAGTQPVTTLTAQDVLVSTNKTVSANDLALYFSFCKNWADFSLGSNLKFIQSTLADYTAQAAALDLGGYWILKKVTNKKLFTAGLALQNIGTPLDFRQDTSARDSLPFQIKGGLKYMQNNFSYLADLNKSLDGDIKLSLGMEYRLPDFGFFRLGYKVLEPNIKYWGRLIDAFSLGFGLPISFIGGEFNYGYSSYGDFGLVHNFSLKFNFDANLRK
ncbi:MAG: PorV/PorQ family protein [Elusimicrobiota bacterium]